VKIGISCWPTVGGSGAVATELGLALAGKGHEVHVISYAEPFRLRGRCEGIQFHEVSVSAYPLFRYPPHDLALAQKMAEVCEQADLDVLHVHYAIPHALAAHLAKQLIDGEGPRIVVTLHGTDITVVGTDPAYRRTTRFGIDRADGVTAVSRWLERETVATFGTERPIEVIPNFVDLERFKPGVDPDVRARYAKSDEPLLVHISNFRPVKRVNDVIGMFAKVRADCGARLVMVGDGPDRAGAEEEAQRLGVADAVTFIGEERHPEGLLASADLYVLPSESESFGLSALEALACGVPVIGTRTGGLPELVQHEVNGHLSEIGDITCMATYACGMLQDPDRHAQFREAARKRAEEFSRDATVARYEDFYRSVT
jgi:N-acetyl-alpha-D-glucosaminyl L-malate synthase BshA